MRVRGEYCGNKIHTCNSQRKQSPEVKVDILFLFWFGLCLVVGLATMASLGYLIFKGYSQSHGVETTNVESESTTPSSGD